jgi:hypothetical protein
MYKLVEGVLEMNYGFGYTETIYTASGGQSGSGFTGVSVGPYDDFVRMVTQIGQGPGCALGNCCEGWLGYNNSGINCGFSRNILGSIVDIPKDKAVAYVRNTVSGW